ncbi:cysteine desulfurase [bacterium]|nr:cysteine desulfurase [bacterium]
MTLSLLNASKEFPIFRQDPSLVYLDNAATMQKPQIVLHTLDSFYQSANANVHRGLYKLAEKSDALYDSARETVQKFLNAKASSEIIFTRGTTESINLVASSVSASDLKPGDEIILSVADHHSLIVPWVMAAKRTNARVKVAKINSQGEIDLEHLRSLLSPRTKIIACAHVSNVLGSINEIKTICKLAKNVGAWTVIDGAQAVSHHPVDVQDLDCDFYAFSAHKAFGPTGIGVLYGRASRLQDLPPYQVGGGMIADVSFDQITFLDAPGRFEAGTPAIAQAVGLGAALKFIDALGRSNLENHLKLLGSELQEKLKSIPGLKIYGSNQCSSGIASFTLEGIHPHDIATVCAEYNVAIRAGHHCCMPLIKELKVAALARASLAFYNTSADIDRLVQALTHAKKVFGSR